MTIKEHTGRVKGIKLTYIGDGRNNVANSLLIGGAKVGMDVRICSPEDLFLIKKSWKWQRLSQKNPEER